MANNFTTRPWVLDTITDQTITAAGAVRLTSTVTITTAVAHGFVVGDRVVISSVTDTSFNGTFLILTVPLTTTFTFKQSGTDVTSGTGTASVHFPDEVNVKHIEFVSYTADAHTAVLQDTNGNVIWETNGKSDLSNVVSQHVSWVQGLKLTTLDAGKILVYIY